MPQYPALIEVGSLTADQGVRLDGAAGDFAGGAATSAGDVNGDGLEDLIVSAAGADANGVNSGAVYVVFGRAGGFGASLSLPSLNAADGFRLIGASEGDFVGRSVAGAGDVNGDGFDDILIGAPSASSGGTAYLVYGKAGGFAANLNLGALDGVNGTELAGLPSNSYGGVVVSSAGDVNGDGFDDILVGASGFSANGTASGAVFVVFGKAGGLGADFALPMLTGSNGFRLSGASAFDLAGRDARAAGDLNGDGFDDLVIGATGRDTGGTDAGAAYVVFGRASGFAANLTLLNLTGTNGFQIIAEAAYDSLGVSVSSTGDINGDGFKDLLVGAVGADASSINSGASYVLFGKAGGFGATVSLANLNGYNGFRIEAAPYAEGGQVVAGGGDYNGDGFDDLLIGSSNLDPYGYGFGSVTVLFGRAERFAPSVNVTNLTDGNSGFVVYRDTAKPQLGANAVAFAGDLNGDGMDDIVVGDAYASNGGADAGAAYVIYGAPPDDEVVRTGSRTDQRIVGGAFDDRLSGLAGADTLTGNGGDDTLLGGSGADRLFGLAGDDELQGGGGGDILEAGSGDDRLFGGSGADRLDGGTGNDLFDGGSGLDTSTYALAGSAVTVSLAITGWQNTGGAGFDNLWSIEGLIGTRFNDVLSGGVFNDALSGGLGADTLSGGDGADTLTGGRGGDSLIGGAGPDVFVYLALNESQGTGVNADRISDLETGDIIDLSAIDAVAAAGGNQAFTLAPSFGGVAGQLVLTYQAASTRTLLQGDVNGDAVADFIVILEGGDYRGFTGFIL